MGRLSWYPAEPEAFFEGTRGFPGDLKGAYRMVLDLIYKADGKLPDDAGYIAGQLGYHVRVWRRFRAELIQREKLYLEDGCLRNPRADAEVAQAFKRLDQTVQAGIESGKKRKQTASKPGSKPDQTYSKTRKSVSVSAENKDLARTGVDHTTRQEQDKTDSLAAAPVDSDPPIGASEAAAASAGGVGEEIMFDVISRTVVLGLTPRQVRDRVASMVRERGNIPAVERALRKALDRSHGDVLAYAQAIVSSEATRLEAAKYAATAPPPEGEDPLLKAIRLNREMDERRHDDEPRADRALPH